MRPKIFFVWIVCSLMSELSFQLIKVCFTRMYWLCVRVHVDLDLISHCDKTGAAHKQRAVCVSTPSCIYLKTRLCRPLLAPLQLCKRASSAFSQRVFSKLVSLWQVEHFLFNRCFSSIHQLDVTVFLTVPFLLRAYCPRLQSRCQEHGVFSSLFTASC